MSVSPDSLSASNMKSQMTPTVDSKREEYRKYLESGGVLQEIYGILKDMYEKKDKPEDPLAYFTNTVAAVDYNTREIKALQDEIKELKLVIENLEKENKFLRSERDLSLELELESSV